MSDGRSHDFHCPNCHAWVSGFDLPGDLRCPICGEGIMVYDLNHDECPGCVIGGDEYRGNEMKPKIAEWIEMLNGPPVNMGGPLTESLTCPECGQHHPDDGGFIKSARGHKRSCQHGQAWRAYEADASRQERDTHT